MRRLKPRKRASRSPPSEADSTDSLLFASDRREVQKMKQGLEVVGVYRPRGKYSLVGAVELIRRAVEHCRNRQIPMLLINASGMTGVPIPSLVDRFLAAEEWAHEAPGMVAVALIIHPNTFIRRNSAYTSRRTLQ